MKSICLHSHRHCVHINYYWAWRRWVDTRPDKFGREVKTSVIWSVSMSDTHARVKRTFDFRCCCCCCCIVITATVVATVSNEPNWLKLMLDYNPVIYAIRTISMKMISSPSLCSALQFGYSISFSFVNCRTTLISRVSHPLATTYLYLFLYIQYIPTTTTTSTLLSLHKSLNAISRVARTQKPIIICV